MPTTETGTIGSLGTPEASELLLATDSAFACETYIFEPSPAEVSLGRLYAVGEVEDRGGLGKELLDMTIQALQREYYREPGRSLTASFESALHQANIVLHDAAESGVRDWMGHFHVAIGVVAETALHISTAGNGLIFLVRKGKTTLLTEDLSYSPITDPLRTFSQVASGTLAARDVLFLGTDTFSNVFRREDLVRFSIEHSAQTISTRLHQLYADQQSNVPLVAMVVSILPSHIATTRPTFVADTTTPHRRTQRQGAVLSPRQPLVIHRTALRAFVALLGQLGVATTRWVRQRLWPLLVRGGRQGGRVVVSASALAQRNVRSAAQHGIQGLVVRPPRVPNVLAWFTRLPRTSKIFAGLALVLAIILVVSIIFLQSKRADDATIQQGSETLHSAETKVAAAETALIYDNRDQARGLLTDATTEVAAVEAQGVYIEEAQKLRASIATLQDRLDRVLRASTKDTRVVGDFGNVSGEQAPEGLAALDGRLFSFNPKTNEVFAMGDDGSAAVVSKTSEGIGFLRLAVPHAADKNIIFITNAPGVAVLDTKLNQLSPQDITWPSNVHEVIAAAVYGSRLYVASKDADNVYSFNKTLRGYSGGSAWITTPNFPSSTIVSIAVDGALYTLHSDGHVRQLFKGQEQELSLEAVDPPLAGAKKIIAFEGGKNLYVFDPAHQRVVIFTKKGALVEQVLLDVAKNLQDIAVTDDEATLYALDGSRVLAIPLGVQEGG